MTDEASERVGWQPEAPKTSQKPPSQARRTLVIWAVVVAMFVVIYAMFDDKGAAPAKASGYSGIWIWAAGLLGLAIPVVFVALQLRGHRRFNAAQVPGLEALAKGEPARAADLFAELARACRGRPSHHAVASYNYGYALLRAGESAKAVGVLLRVENTPGVQVGGVRLLAPVALARAYAIGGDVAKARAWLDIAKARPLADNVVYGRAILASVEALVRCREGKYAEALAVLDESWQIIENFLSLDLCAEPWLVRAFCVAMQSTVRDAAAAERWLRALRILSPEQSRWLTLHWPELEQFAVANDLVRAAPARPALAPTA